MDRDSQTITKRQQQLAANESATQGLTWYDCAARGYTASKAASWMGTTAAEADRHLRAAKREIRRSEPGLDSNWPLDKLKLGARLVGSQSNAVGQTFAHIAPA